MASHRPVASRWVGIVLLGGCLGSFLAGLLLLPLLGAKATSLGMAVLALAAILAL
ncbi:MAG: hypothetical protein PHP88_11465 [bacterium]|nr:hypothetical protein [bacterium]